MTPEEMRALADEQEQQFMHFDAYLEDRSRRTATALRIAADQLETATAVVKQYAGWYEYSPEDSWRFERDIRAALVMEQYSGDNDD